MRLHGNARTCFHSRLLIVRRVEDGWTVAAAAGAAGVSERTAAKWLARYRREGRAGLVDRSSAPLRIPRRTPLERERAIESLRRLRMTAAEIAEILRMPLSTVSAVLKRIGLGKRSRLQPVEPPNRYECARPGELVHIDVKKLGRFTRPGHRLLGRGPGPSRREPATSTYTSASTTTAASPTSRCSQTNEQQPRSVSSAAPSSGLPPKTCASSE
jgi:transposase